MPAWPRAKGGPGGLMCGQETEQAIAVEHWERKGWMMSRQRQRGIS